MGFAVGCWFRLLCCGLCGFWFGVLFVSLCRLRVRAVCLRRRWLLVDLFCCGVVALLPGFWVVGVRYLLFNIGLVVLFYLFLAVLWLVGLCYCWFGYLMPFGGYLIGLLRMLVVLWAQLASLCLRGFGCLFDWLLG